MRIIVLCVLLLAVFSESFGQLVRRKDYDAAFALQVGGESGILVPLGKPGMSVSPTAGLKMTFPFTRKWFLGSEINYSELKYKSTYDTDGCLLDFDQQVQFRGEWKTDFRLRQIQVPVYLKYMLNCNRASVLFGLFGTYVFDPQLKASLSGESWTAGGDEPSFSVAEAGCPATMEQWNAGITIGYEHQIVKHLNVMCRVSAGLREVMKTNHLWDKKLFPLQACLTLSYDLFRIGDCGCD